MNKYPVSEKTRDFYIKSFQCMTEAINNPSKEVCLKFYEKDTSSIMYEDECWYLWDGSEMWNGLNLEQAISEIMITASEFASIIEREEIWQ